MSIPLRRHVGAVFATGAIVATVAVGVPLVASATSPTSSTPSSATATPASPTTPTTLASSQAQDSPRDADRSAKLDRARQRCSDALDRRTKAVARALSSVQKATGVDAKVRTEVASQLTDVSETLARSKSAIASARTFAELRTACEHMITETRVFKLYGPKTRAVVATNRLAQADQYLERIGASADQVWARAAERGVPEEQIADAKAHLGDAAAQFKEAHSRIDGLTGKLVPVTTDQVNDHSADAVLQDAHARLKAARGNARQAREDLRAIRNDLRTG